MHEHLGQTIATRLSSCQSSCLIVAPFMQSRVIELLLDGIPAPVQVTLVTRWRPVEIALGVSDLRVLDVVEKRPFSALLLCDNLHAKYYRMDEDGAFVSSANATAAGLGYSVRRNLEVAVWTPLQDGLRSFENELLSLSRPATRSVAEAMRAAADEVGKLPIIERPHRERDEDDATDSMRIWLPKTRNPHDLVRRYLEETDSLTTTARESTEHDLVELDIPPGLDESGFRACIRAALMAHPVIMDIDDLLSSSQRFGAVRDYLRDHPSLAGVSFDPSYSWQTIFRWLLFFLPDRYEAWTANYSEIIRRRPARAPASS